MDFADTPASVVLSTCALPEIEFSIPVVNEFIKDPFRHPQLFIIYGHAQSYKTSIAAELLSTFISFKHLQCEAVWLDCDYKFPIDLLRSKKINLNKLKVAQCRCNEEIIFNLLSIEHEIENGAPIRAITIDTINSSFWIETKSKKLYNYKKDDLITIVERFVSRHGITMILVMDDLAFDSSQEFNDESYKKLECFSKKPGKGQIKLEPSSKQQYFTILEDRSFHWIKSRSVSNGTENEENRESDNDDDQ